MGLDTRLIICVSSASAVGVERLVAVDTSDPTDAARTIAGRLGDDVVLRKRACPGARIESDEQ